MSNIGKMRGCEDNPGNMSTGLTEWFRNEVHFWRCVHAVVIVVALQFVLTPVALFFLQFSVYSPFDGFYDWLASLIDSPWHHMCLLSAVFVLAVYHVTCVNVAPVIHGTRLAQVVHFGHPRSHGQALLRAFAGAIFVRAILGMSGGPYARVDVRCSPSAEFEECMSDAYVFLVLHGAFTSISLHLSQLAAKGSCLAFPPIQVVSLRKHLPISSTVRRAAWETMRHAYIYYLLFFFLGSFLKYWIYGDMEPTIWVGDLQTVWGLINLRLFWALVVTGAALRTVDHLAVLMRDYCLTKGYQFPVAVQFEAERPLQLSTAMASRGCAFVQYLSFQDFRQLAEHSPARRAQVFAVSSPGFHPLHWGALCEACLVLVRQFCHALGQVDMPPPPQPPNPQAATPQASKTTEGASFLRMRPLSLATPPPDPLQIMNQVQPPPPQPKVSIVRWMLDGLKSHPLASYFISELPDVKSRQLFADCQPLIWAIEGLCLLVCASKTEDKYGVVQFSLPKIFSALLEMDQLLERHSKRCSILRRPNSSLGRELRLGRALAAAVTTGLYQMTITFKQHLGSIDLTTEHMRRLKQFEDFIR
ncbi:nuclear division cycle 1 isoform X1 [Rhipicephalus microplus]|uniref:nuclear division cycle 1 isoform X1 n=1 Tax=Rhipicephalus microplus TaxID=6941 RepID=UPI0023764C14